MDAADLTRCPVCGEKPRNGKSDAVALGLAMLMTVILALVAFVIVLTPLLWVLHRACAWAFA